MCNAYMSELWGVLEGLKCVDSAIVVSVLIGGGSGSPSGRSLVMQTMQLMDLD
jgi:hypothetical protein